MTDVRKLMARLNPAVCRFDIGQGGIPDLTPQDIAAAIGMVPAGLGRELMCRLWWPDGARLSPKELDAELRREILVEWLRRARRLESAKLQLHMAEEDHHGSVQRARSEVEAARGDRWPSVCATYRRIRETVLAELESPPQCAKCHGRGFNINRAGVHIACVACEGRGWVPVSDRQRATSLGVNESTYRRCWRDVYQWLHAQCTDAEAMARRRLAARLNRDVAAA